MSYFLPTVLPLELLPSHATKGREFYSLSCSRHHFFPSLSLAIFSNPFLRGMCCLSERTRLINNEANIHSLLHLLHSIQQPVTVDAVFNLFCSNSSWTSRFDRKLVVVSSVSYLLILSQPLYAYIAGRPTIHIAVWSPTQWQEKANRASRKKGAERRSKKLAVWRHVCLQLDS